MVFVSYGMMGYIWTKIRSNVPKFNGIAIVSTMKEIKGIFLLQLSNKKRILKDIHSLVYYFKWFNLNGKFNACSNWLKCILERRKGRNMERRFRILLFWNSSSNIYYHAVPRKCRVRTNVWVLKFSICSVAKQEVNRIVTDMCARWQWLPKTACRYEAI